jgi:hypothetical protein
MRNFRWSRSLVLVALGLSTAALASPGAGPAPGSATGTLTVDGKSVALSHAIAFNAGQFIHLVITDQALPPDQVKSEFQLGMYEFQHHVVGFQLMLDSAHKVKTIDYLWEMGHKPCPDCFQIEISGGAEGPLTGTVKSTPKALETQKLKADATFSAPFAKPSAGKQ